MKSPSTPINSKDLNRFIRNGEKFHWAEDSTSLLDTTGSSNYENVWGEVAVIKHKKKGLINRRLDRRRKAALSREDFHNTILDIFGENKAQTAEEEIKRNKLGLRMLQFIQNALTKQKSTPPAEQPVNCQQHLGISTTNTNERWVYINISVSDSLKKTCCRDSDTAESRTQSSDAAGDEPKEVEEEVSTPVATKESESHSADFQSLPTQNNTLLKWATRSPLPNFIDSADSQSLPTENNTLMKWLATKSPLPNVIETLSTDSCGTMKTKLFNFGYGSSQLPKSQSAIMSVLSSLSPSECGLPRFKEYLSATSDMRAKTFLRKDDLVALGFAAISGVGVKSRVALAIAGAVTVRRPQDDRGLEWVRQYLQNTGKTSNRKTLEDLLVLGQPQLTQCPVDIYGLWELMSLVPKPEEGEAATCYFAFHGSHIFLFAAHDLARGTRLTSSN